MTDRDPVAEAAKRSLAFRGSCWARPCLGVFTAPDCSCVQHEMAALRAALAPYGGLEAAVKKLEEGEGKVNPAASNEQVNTKRLKKLQDLCGYVQNGTSDSFTVSLDDATRTYCIRQGNNFWFGISLHEAIDKLPEEPHL